MIGSDSTQLTLFSGNVTAHPVYLTLGNIPSKIRHQDTNDANVPIALLPSMPASIGTKERGTMGFRKAKLRLYQEALRIVMQPLMDVAER